jgi:hypothetical protein
LYFSDPVGKHRNTSGHLDISLLALLSEGLEQLLDLAVNRDQEGFFAARAKFIIFDSRVLYVPFSVLRPESIYTLDF